MLCKYKHNNYNNYINYNNNHNNHKFNVNVKKSNNN